MNKLKELEATLFTIYKKNLSYLKNFHRTLYERILEFEKLGIENYHIDFNNRYFELIDNKNKTSLYNCNSFYDADYRAKHIKESKAIFSLIVDKIDPINYNMQNELSAHKLIQTLLDNKKNNHIQATNKFIFIGTLLGLHINEINKVISSKTYLIIEPSLEKFRLSLFFADFEEINRNSKIFFSIQEEDFEIEKTINDFLNFEFSYNNYIKFELASESEYFLIDKLKNILTSRNPLINPFTEDILHIKRGFNIIKRTKGLLKTHNIKIPENIPVLILGAGPSLETNQNFIKRNKDKFIIVSAAATLKRLERINVIPDIIVSIDKKDKEILEQFNVNNKYYNNSIILLGSKTNLNLLKKIDSNKTFIVQTNKKLLNNLNTFNCASVGDFMCKLFIELKTKKIYLLGIDASFQGDKIHDSLHTNSSKTFSNSPYEKEKIEVEGNFAEKVITNLLYAEIIDSFRDIQTKGAKIYNLSNGAKLANTIPLHIKDLNLNSFNTITKSSFQKDLLNILESNTIKTLEPIDKSKYKKELAIIKKIEIDTSDKKILQLVKNYPSSEVIKIVHKYLLLINPYISTPYKSKIKDRYLIDILKELKIIFKDLI